MEREFIHPDTLANFPRSFTQVVTTANAGAKTIYISGQVAIDTEGNVVGKDDLAAQTEQAYLNLTLALKAAGAGVEDVVKVTTYVPNMKPEDARTIAKARRKHFTQESLPASTLVGVHSLVMPEFLIEVEAVAVVDAG